MVKLKAESSFTNLLLEVQIYSLYLYHISTNNKPNMENNKKLTRSSNRMVAGVCAGMAEYFGWDPTLLRIVYILATIFTVFAGVIIYIILWIVMPVKMPSDGYQDGMNNRLH